MAMDLRTRSVVQMAVAAAAAAAPDDTRLVARVGMARSSSGILIRLPMTPVDSRSTSAGSTPSAAATAAADATLSSIPSVPVAALAWPALMSTATAVSLASSAVRQYITGAAATRFRVNTPAATAGLSATTRAQSARVPVARRPALNAAALKPLGAHTPPSTTVHAPAGSSALTGASGSVNTASSKSSAAAAGSVEARVTTAGARQWAGRMADTRRA
mmetsp:Transcript_34382/g.55190  ORF Transcript_34382/g.55190 Transcript_34382/m.55190 type:complete len:217 (+) Transcript_34382:1126-1776(+)